MTSVEDATVCHDEKLASGSTAAYVSSAELFLKDTIFREGEAWPNVIWAPSNMIDSDEAPNLQISVSALLVGAHLWWQVSEETQPLLLFACAVDNVSTPMCVSPFLKPYPMPRIVTAIRC